MKAKKSTTNISKIEKVLKDILRDMATKDDLKRELSKYPTKEDLKNELKNFATKEDLKKALTKHPTKEDLKRELDDLAIHLTLSADKHKAEKSVVEALEKRVDRIEQKLPIVHQ